MTNNKLSKNELDINVLSLFIITNISHTKHTKEERKKEKKR
jgi:hypothetical protein